jgi:predicted CXXCH cytochrome family protein
VEHSLTPQASVGMSRWGVDLDGALGWHTGPAMKTATFGMIKAGVPLGTGDDGFGRRPGRTREPPSADDGDRLKFSHKQHLDVGVACEDCHGDVKGAAAGARLIPTHAACAECHAEVEDQQACGMCHSRADRPRKLTRADRGLRFAHATHAQKRECTGCHGPVEASQTVDDDLIPDMAVCLSCHEHAQHFAMLECGRCHAKPVQGAAPLTEMYAHTGDWKRRHQDVARGKGAVCATCHDQSFCGDCHESIAPANPASLFAEQPARAQFHRGWYLDRHAVDARVDPASCLRCHGRTTCDSCHLEAGVSGLSRNAASPHPPEWLDRGSSRSHAAAARRNLVECAACHDQGPASNCVSCHSRGGVSPHGSGFDSSLTRSDARVCRICHAQ